MTRSATGGSGQCRQPPCPEFGPNDWFVEEKYQQFLADPASVDPIWRDYFAEIDVLPTRPSPPRPKARRSDLDAGTRPPNGGSGNAGNGLVGRSGSPGKAPQSAAATTASAPTIPAGHPRARAARHRRPAAPAAEPARNRRSHRGPTKRPHCKPRRRRRGRLRTGHPDRGEAGTPPARPTAHRRPEATPRPPRRVPGRRRSAAKHHHARRRPGPQRAGGSGAGGRGAGETAPLRGMAAAVVRNMTASLEVPTATSVRAVPAKLSQTTGS